MTKPQTIIDYLLLLLTLRFQLFWRATFGSSSFGNGNKVILTFLQRRRQTNQRAAGVGQGTGGLYNTQPPAR